MVKGAYKIEGKFSNGKSKVFRQLQWGFSRLSLRVKLTSWTRDHS